MIKLSDELLRLVSNLVLKDVTTIAFCGLVIGIMLTFFGRALMEPYQFARNKLPNQSALLHAIRERSGTTLVALIIVAGMSAYAWSSVAAVVSHATPPWQAEEVCFRVPQQCRSCVAFLDQRGRVISPACQRFSDDAGLVQLTPKRWANYLPHSVRLSCGSKTAKLRM